jgi:hypothetical protein
MSPRPGRRRNRRAPKLRSITWSRPAPTAITITEHDGVCSIHIGHRIDPHAVSIQWVPEAGARAIKQARRNAGANPDAATAAKALEDGFLNKTCGAPKQLNLRLYLGKVPPRFPA